MALRSHRSTKCKAVQQDLKQARLLPDLQQVLLSQLPRWSDASLSSAAFSVCMLVQLRCFRPSNELLDVLDAELLCRLQRNAGQRASASEVSCAVEVLHLFTECGWPASACLQERVAAWLLTRHAQALTMRQAEDLLRAWVSFAVTPGAPACKTLPAVLQTLEGLLSADVQQEGGATDVLQRALTVQISAARSVEARSCMHPNLSSSSELGSAWKVNQSPADQRTACRPWPIFGQVSASTLPGSTPAPQSTGFFACAFPS